MLLSMLYNHQYVSEMKNLIPTSLLEENNGPTMKLQDVLVDIGQNLLYVVSSTSRE